MKKVYICCSLKLPNYEHVSGLLARLPDAIHLRPQPSQLDELTGSNLRKKNVVEADVAMIQYCDEVWVLGKFGRDCSWEIGYATALHKRVRILKEEDNAEIISSDWMFLHGETLGNLTVYDTIFDFKNAVLSTADPGSLHY